jgi:hypothetical protein
MSVASYYVRLKIFIVNIGILLVLSLNNCTTDRKRAIEQRLNQIKQETLSNKKSLDSTIIQIQSNIAKIDTLILLLSLNKDCQKICDMSLDLLKANSGLYMENLAIKSIIKTDDIRWVKDFEQKESIIDLYKSYKDVNDFDVLSENFYLINYATYLKNNRDKICDRTKDNSLYKYKRFINKLESFKRINENRIHLYQLCIIKIDNYLFYDNK